MSVLNQICPTQQVCVARKVDGGNGWLIAQASNERKQLELIAVYDTRGIIFFAESSTIARKWGTEIYADFVLKIGESTLDGMCYTGSQYTLKSKDVNWAIVITNSTWKDIWLHYQGISICFIFFRFIDVCVPNLTMLFSDNQNICVVCLCQK